LHGFDRVFVEQVIEQVYQRLFELPRFEVEEFFELPKASVTLNELSSYTDALSMKAVLEMTESRAGL